jgi:hypothetical protein
MRSIQLSAILPASSKRSSRERGRLCPVRFMKSRQPVIFDKANPRALRGISVDQEVFLSHANNKFLDFAVEPGAYPRLD